MKLSDRLPSEFLLRDALDAALTEQLMSASRALDIALPLVSESAGRAERERAASALADRAEQLRQALELSAALLLANGCDVQVLTVTLRLLVEAEGWDGLEDALRVLTRALEQGFGELTASLTQLPERERERKRRKWARYLDAIFEQMYLWLARQQQHTPAVAAQLSVQGRWETLLDDVATGLGEVGLSVSRWESVERLMREGIRSAREAANASATPSEVSSSPTPEGSAHAPAAPRGPGEESREPGVAEPSDVSKASAVLRVSERFWELQRRMSALQQLLERGEYEKAGIVASDLRENVERFDVAAVFPGLFAPYFEACAEHAGALANHQPDLRQLRASALANLYRVDLDRFLALRVAPKGD